MSRSMTDRCKDPCPRPAPEGFLNLIRRQQRGKLKVYLGSAAGVGKTYEMLQEGNRLKREGVDVVIGYVEPHDRQETIAQIGDLEIVPPRTVKHGNLVLRDLDLDAVLARKPTVALVDELAHTNAPGSRHEKRYDDVEELQTAGINVITTLNIQHFESLYNIVEEATGIAVRERIPDQVVAEADQIVNVDLEADDLIARLKAGKIYSRQQAEGALTNFFTVQNLTRLRELTLSEMANFLDRRQREDLPGQTKPSAMGKVMVALSSRGPDPEALLRKAVRLSVQLNADWYVVYVRTPQEDEAHIPAETHRRISDMLDLARKMGGSIVVLKNRNIPQALIEFTTQNGMTHLVMGRPAKRGWLAFLKPTLLDLLIRNLPQVDFVIV